VVALLASAGVAATGRASVATTPATYVVQRGDSLSSIAAHYGTSVQELARANRIGNRDLIVIGRQLVVPNTAGSGHAPGVLPARLRAHPDRLALRPLFEKWAAHYGVPADLIEALAWIESGWQTGVVSRTGAIGVGQLQPATVDFMQLLIGMRLDPRSANDNIRMSARFLRYLLDRTGNNVPVSLAAYYQGLRSVTTGSMLPDTKQYVAAVQAVRPSFG
jgi:soluble lytic murein transglycosylase-like protein